MNRNSRLIAVLVLTAVVGLAVVFASGVAPFDFAASDDRGDGEIHVRVQARETKAGRVEVRAQSSSDGGEWAVHTPDARFLPPGAESGLWYSSDPIVVSAPAVAPIDDESAYTQRVVAQAIGYYDEHGREETVRFYNTSEAVDQQWYVFILDEHDRMLANSNQDLIGLAAADVHGPDGYPAGLMIVAVASEDGAWVDYQFNNPALGRAQLKHSWIVRHDGLIFGSGWYEDAPSKDHEPGAYTRSFVDRALELHRVLGRDAAIEYYSSAESVDGEWYVFIVEPDGTRLAHPWLPLGENILNGGPDVTGYNFRQDIVAVDDRDWISYVFNNPDTDQQERKHTWVVRHDGLLFCSGWYEPADYEAPDS